MALWLRSGLCLLTALTVVVWAQAVAAQTYEPDDPLPPGAQGQVYELRGMVYDLQATVVPLQAATATTAREALEELGARVDDKEIKIDLSADVLFDFDKADLRAEAVPALTRIKEVLAAYPEASALIEGHTDAIGGDAYNQLLSERRAEAVWRWLVEAGVTTKMTTHGWGKSRPVASNTRPDGSDDPEGRQKNRRVEIVVQTD
jgi:outer membrane protein OmpA-like peptidoglycan-associated protein